MFQLGRSKRKPDLLQETTTEQAKSRKQKTLGHVCEACGCMKGCLKSHSEGPDGKREWKEREDGDGTGGVGGDCGHTQVLMEEDDQVPKVRCGGITGSQRVTAMATSNL